MKYRSTGGKGAIIILHHGNNILALLNVHLLHGYGGFHLHLSVFVFLYQFNTRIGFLVHFIICKWLVQKDFNNISVSFQKFVVVLHEKERSFYTHLFCCTEMRWLFISATKVIIDKSCGGTFLWNRNLDSGRVHRP
jgi:hypothetical protein